MKLLSFSFDFDLLCGTATTAFTAFTAFTVVLKTITSTFTRPRFYGRKDIWLRYAVHFCCLLFSVHNIRAFGYPTPQQEHDLLILNAISRRSTPTHFFPEDTIMEMISRSNNDHFTDLHFFFEDCLYIHRV